MSVGRKAVRALMLSFGALLLTAAVGAPAEAFVGRVLDAQGQPIAGAEVTVLGRAGAVRTDSDGRFTWSPDPALPFEILVTIPGGTFMAPVLVTALSDSVEVRVAPLVREVVTVSGSAGSIVTAPGAGSASLSALEIAQRRPANLVQTLENVAGVSQVSEGQAAVPAIRGLARGRTLILIDGARVSSERRAGPSAAYLDPDLIESVDVARGPGSVPYGSDALGGVISIRTRSVAVGAPLSLRVSGTLGAGIPDRRASFDLSRGFARGGVLLAAHARDVDDYDGPTGRVFNSGYTDRGVLGRGTYQMAGGTLTGSWQGDFGRDIERPRDNSRSVRFFYPVEDSHRFTLGFDRLGLAGFSRVSLNAFAGSYEQVTDQDRFATETTVRSVERADVSARDFHVRGSGERLFTRGRWEVGVDINGRHGLRALDVAETYAPDGSLARVTENVSVDSARRVDSGVYGSVEVAAADVLSLAGGVRGDYVTTRNRGGFFGDRSTGNGAASGYVAATAGSFGGVSVTAQMSRGFRDPVLSDRYFRGPSGRGFITGEPTLEPESSLQFDLGARYTSSRLRAATYFYVYRISDLIERYSTQTDMFFFRNRGRARVRGFEAEAQASLGWGLTFESAFHISRGRALDDNAFLDDIAPPTVTTQLRKVLPFRGAFAQVRAARYSKDTRFGPTERAVPGATLIDLAGGIGVGSGVDVRLAARNLLNEDYLASQDVRTIAAPGRSVALTVVFDLRRR